VTGHSIPLTNDRQLIPWWLIGVVILGSLLMAMGGLIALVKPAMLVSPDDAINGAVHVYADYLVSRNLALALMLIAALAMRARGALSILMLLTAWIQLLDAGLDVMEGRWVLVPGMTVFAIVFFLGAARLSSYWFWRSAAWRFGNSQAR
jgi:hypothetical protein